MTDDLKRDGILNWGTEAAESFKNVSCVTVSERNPSLVMLRPENVTILTAALVAIKMAFLVKIGAQNSELRISILRCFEQIKDLTKLV